MVLAWKAKAKELYQEREELYRLLTKMSGLLDRTANALKGEPDEDSLHSWHDLPEVAKKRCEEQV